jgi:hypothetical protein
MSKKIKNFKKYKIILLAAWLFQKAAEIKVQIKVSMKIMMD